MSEWADLVCVVRHHLRPAREERYRKWLVEHIEHLSAEMSDLAGVRQFHWEKSDELYLYFLVFYHFRGDTQGGAALIERARRIREAWRPQAASIRGFTALPFVRIWHGGSGTRTEGPHPLIVERLGVVPEQEEAWNRWSEDVLWPGELRDLPIAAVHRYRALVGEPRYYLQIQEFEDSPTMWRKVVDSEPGPRPGYWSSWAEWMPYLEDFERLVYEPSDGLAPTPRDDHDKPTQKEALAAPR